MNLAGMSEPSPQVQGRRTIRTPPSETHESEHSDEQPCPKRIGESIAEALDAIPGERDQVRRYTWEEHEREQRKFSAWKEFIAERGERYDTCRLDNFETNGDPKKSDVLGRLQKYSELMANRKHSGLVLYGPKGTGKDHLMVGLVRVAIRFGRSVVWRNGVDLYGEIRDRIDDEQTEASLVRKFVQPDILYISDPLPPIGVLTEWQASFLFRILDKRYSNCKPNWVTVNVASGAEFEQRAGAQNVERLKDGAAVIYCDWPSYRKVAEL